MKEFNFGSRKVFIDSIAEHEITIRVYEGDKYEKFEIDYITFEKLYRTLVSDKWGKFSKSTFDDFAIPDPYHSIPVQASEVVILYGGKQDVADVYIALPQKSLDFKVIENIQNACGDIMEALGFELEQKEEPVFGSFFQKLRFKLIGVKTEAEIADGYTKAKQALEAKYIKLPTAESTEKLATATANLLVALKDIDEGVLRLGALLVVKYQIDNKTKIFSETLSPDLSSFFDNNPQMLKDPKTVYLMLESIKGNPNLFKETDGVNSTITSE